MLDFLFFLFFISIIYFIKDSFARVQTLIIIFYFSIPNFLYRHVDEIFRYDVFNLGDLTYNQNLTFNLVITFYLVFLFVGYKYSNINFLNIKMPSHNQSKTILVFVLTPIIFIFYFLKISATFEEGYFSYHQGNLSLSKNLIIIILEYLFLIHLLSGMSTKNKWLDLIYLTFHLLIILTGLRLPGILGIILWILIRKKIKLNFKNIAITTFSIYITPILLILVQRFRMGFKIDSQLLDRVYTTSYFEIINQLNFSAETLRTVIVAPVDYYVNLFFNFQYFFEVFVSKVFGEPLNIQSKIELGAFGFSQTNFFRPDLIEIGVTLGNSMLSESYAVLGFFGIMLIGLFNGILFKSLKIIRSGEYNLRRNFIWISHYMIAIPLLRAPRGSSYDWVLQSFIFLLLANIILRMHFKRN